MRFLLRSLLFSFLLSASLLGARGEEPPIRFEASHDAMGTQFTIVAYGMDARFLAQVANEAFEEIDSLDAQMSNYRAESELSRINREAARGPVLVEPGLFQLIEDSLRYGRETDGAFDITVGPLMKAWGFFRGQGRLPAPAEVAAVMKRVGYRHIQIEREQRTVRFDAEGVELDLGGIAKGYAVDRVAGILRSYGIRAALISSGTSSIHALGSPPGERAWRVTLRDPFHAAKAGDVFELRDYSFSASGNYERFFRLGGKTYSHIMDPRAGRPVMNMLSAAVLAPLGVESDALSTSFFVLGVEGSRKVLARHPGLIVIFYRPAGTKQRYDRVVLRSPSFDLPAGTLAEVVGANPRPPRSE